MGVDQWPLVLAGPMVRRVEPGLVAVWVALKESKAVRLTVFQGTTDTGSGDGVFTGGTPVATGDSVTMRVGDHVHVAVTVAKPQSGGASFAAGQTFAYNLSFGAPTGTFSADADLKSLKLLQDQAAVATGDNPTPRHAALGYDPNVLPTFVLPPADLTGLRLAHGSCRRIHADCADMIPALDALIRDNRGTVEQRPQQLFLTGDQIYSDDVAAGLLTVLTPLANELLGVTEQLPTTSTLQGAQGVRLWPADLAHFPPGFRKALVMDDAKLSTVDGPSHLLSFGEFVAMHLLSYANVLWPATMPTFGDVYWGRTLPLSEFDGVLAGVDLPPDIWRTHLGLGVEGGYTRYGAATKYLKDDTSSAPVFEATEVAKVLEKIADDKGLAAEYDESNTLVAAFRDGLAEARRVFANIATYMICDDHEITDDWNLNQKWKDKVYTAPLGRTVLRNGILAYFVCQGWGNDPVAYEAAGSKSKELLDAIPNLFQTGDDVAPKKETADAIDLLFGLDGKDPPVQWHYRVDGPKHRVLVLDSRSRRSYRDRVAPPTNLSETAMKEQIPDGPLPEGLEVLFVVAPLPVLGLPLSDEVAGAIAFRAYDAFKVSDIAGMPGTNPDAAESWANDPEALEELLKRLAVYKKVVILSGDVHYAHSCEASYWRKADAAPSRFAQFTSSGVKNDWPSPVMTLARSFGLGQAIERLLNPVERLGWDDDSPDVLTLPAGVDILPPGRAKLRSKPVLLPSNGWPPGTKTARDPEWTWRFRLSRDARAAKDLPELARPTPFDETNPDKDIAVTIEGYRAVAKRHAAQMDRVAFTRQVLFESNIGVITFATADGRLTVKHELHAKPKAATKAEVYTTHTVVLTPASTDPPEARPTIAVPPNPGSPS
jgi:hypothetical protein